MTKFTAKKKHQGFTLIEVVSVLLIVAIIFSTVSYFAIGFVKNQLTHTKQLTFFEQARLSHDYLAKVLASALPSTLQLSHNQQCLSFHQIKAGGILLDQRSAPNHYSIILDNDDATVINEPYGIKLIPFRADPATKKDERSLYSLSQTAVILENPQNQDLSKTPFVVLAQPSAICFFENQIRLYRSVNQQQTVDLTDEFELLMTGVSVQNTFNIRKLSVRAAEITVRIQSHEQHNSLKLDNTILLNHE